MSQKLANTILKPIYSEWGPNHEAAVVLAAAFRHSNEKVRGMLRARLLDRVRRRRPLHEPRAIEQVLLGVTGTALEPFRLGAEPLELAVLAVQATFSQSSDWPSIRIVSEETIGVDGGLVLSAP